MKFFSLSTLLGLIALLEVAQAQRIRHTENAGWYFAKGNPAWARLNPTPVDDWEKVKIPHTWNDRDAFNETKSYYRGDAWYKHRLHLDSTLRGRKLFLYFEGVNQEAEVLVNGRIAGKHQGGYTAFCVDITDYVTFDHDWLAVRVTNKFDPGIPPLTADFTFYGGIYRDVHLIATDPVHFEMLDHASTGIYLSTPKINRQEADLNIRGTFRNESEQAQTLTVRHQIRNPKGELFHQVVEDYKAEAGQQIHFNETAKGLEGFQLWSPDNPYLYQVVSTIEHHGEVLDRVENPLGFRWVEVDNQGYYLNGKEIALHGVNRHQDRQGLGNALPDQVHRHDAQLLKEMGANFCRIAHYPQDPALHEAFDRQGILTWEEIPIVNEVGLLPEFRENCRSQLLDMIRQHYNHPSVVMWGYMNEVLLQKWKYPKKMRQQYHFDRATRIAGTLDSICKAEDPQRHTAMACHGSDLYNKNGTSEIPDILGYNLYFGWYATEGENYQRLAQFLEDDHQVHPQKPIIISEYGAGSDRRLNSLQPERFDFTIQWQQDYLENNFRIYNNKEYVVGTAEWNFVDFGSANRSESMPRVNNKGLLTRDRKKKDVYYFYKAQLSEEPFVHIATRDWPKRGGLLNAEGKLTHPIKIYSNQAKVELRLGGESLGTKTVNSDGFARYEEVPLKPGKNFLTCRAADQPQIQDRFTLEVRGWPQKLASPEFREIAINAGCNVQYYQAEGDRIWLPGQKYQAGSFGRKGGELFRRDGYRIGTTAEITGTWDDPLFQTAVEGLKEYRFDVPPGNYELEFFFAELYSKEKVTIVNDVGGEEVKERKDFKRRFDVLVNGHTAIADLNLRERYGNETAAIIKVPAQVEEGDEGLRIEFRAQAGEPLLNGLRVVRKR